MSLCTKFVLGFSRLTLETQRNENVLKHPLVNGTSVSSDKKQTDLSEIQNFDQLRHYLERFDAFSFVHFKSFPRALLTIFSSVWESALSIDYAILD